jgi:leucyl aminopeptidase
MEIRVITGDINRLSTPALVLGYCSGEAVGEGALAAADTALGGAIGQMVASEEIKGKTGELTLIHTLGRLPAQRLVVLGLGQPGGLTPDRLRGLAAEVCRFLRQKGVLSFCLPAPGIGQGGITAEIAAQTIAEGAILGAYTFRSYITKKADFDDMRELNIIAPGEDVLAAMSAACDRGRILAEATNLARDMANEPANVMTPARMAARAQDLARECGLELLVLEKEQMQELGMGGLLGVAQGSQQPPRFISLFYAGREGREIDLALVGKAITFDSGGISIKPSEKMEEMKGDMAGGAAVMAAMGAIAKLAPRLNVAAYIPATENLPSGTALKPGDILRLLNGKTVEVISTDAEGRLVLGDALSYAVRQGARRIVDVATLTGSCKVALGNICSGLFSNNQLLADMVLAAGAAAGELLWQLPMYEEYKELNRSDVADIKNTGGRYAGSIAAAHFLAEFAGEGPWVHLDIAGTDLADKDRGYIVKGATGVPVRTLVNLVLKLAADREGVH